MPTPSPLDRNDARVAGVAAGLGCSIVVIIIICVVGGILLDQWLDTSPILTLSGVTLGLVAAGYQLYELAMMGKTDETPRVVTRQIARIAHLRSTHTGKDDL